MKIDAISVLPGPPDTVESVYTAEARNLSEVRDVVGSAHGREN